MKNYTSAIILAAGESKRMNFPKALLKYNENTTFIEKIATEFNTFDVENIFIVTNITDNQNIKNLKIIAELSGRIKILINNNPELGRLHSLKIALTELLTTKTEYCFLHNVDNPYFEQDILNILFINRETDKYIVPSYNQKGGHPILIPQKILKYLSASDAKNRIDERLKNFSAKKIDMQNKNILININDPETYKSLIINK